MHRPEKGRKDEVTTTARHEVWMRPAISVPACSQKIAFSFAPYCCSERRLAASLGGKVELPWWCVCVRFPCSFVGGCGGLIQTSYLAVVVTPSLLPFSGRWTSRPLLLGPLTG